MIAEYATPRTTTSPAPACMKGIPEGLEDWLRAANLAEFTNCRSSSWSGWTTASGASTMAAAASTAAGSSGIEASSCEEPSALQTEKRAVKDSLARDPSRAAGVQGGGEEKWRSAKSRLTQ